MATYAALTASHSSMVLPPRRSVRAAPGENERRSRETRRANVSRAALLYSIAPIVSRAIRSRALIRLFMASVSAVNSPCFMAFLLPLGGPPPAPCIRQTLQPFTAGERHFFPLLFDVARHLNAWRICKSMGLNLRFFARPHPLRRRVDVADDRLPALGDVDVLDGHFLLAT
jgi:hypothetical protein